MIAKEHYESYFEQEVEYKREIELLTDFTNTKKVMCF